MPNVIAVSGASGLVGSSLVTALKASGHQVRPLVRKSGSNGSEEILWDLQRGIANPERIKGVDTVIHLAGENIASGRWNAAIKDLNLKCGKSCDEAGTSPYARAGKDILHAVSPMYTDPEETLYIFSNVNLLLGYLQNKMKSRNCNFSIRTNEYCGVVVWRGMVYPLLTWRS